jgi:hypothetical protein
MQWPNEKGQNDKVVYKKLHRKLRLSNTKHIIFVGLFHSNAGKIVIDNFS